METNKPITEKMNPEDSTFIPEIEIDEVTGEIKKKPFTQGQYESSSDYGG